VIAGGAQSSLAERPYLKTALEECATLSLLLAYASAWFFATDGPCVVDASAPRFMRSKGMR
jgi:hypothetical protein